jgi:hypothetical protein
LSEEKEGKVHGLPFSWDLEAVILPQNEIVGLSYRTDVLFGQHRRLRQANLMPVE